VRTSSLSIQKKSKVQYKPGLNLIFRLLEMYCTWMWFHPAKKLIHIFESQMKIPKFWMFIGLSKVETQNHISLMWPSTRHNWCPGFGSDYLRWLLVMFSMSACLQRFCHRVFPYHLPAQVHHPLSACEQRGQKYCPLNSNSFSSGPWASCLKKRHSKPSLKTVDIFCNHELVLSFGI
jgi:hypothetical protein